MSAVSINRDKSTDEKLREWADLLDWYVTKQGLRSMRVQWNIDEYAEPLTMYTNGSGTFIVAPGEKPMPAEEWLSS